MSSERAPQHDPRHEPVMLHEVVEALAVRPGGRYVDATVGLGGHARAIVEAAQPGGRLLGIDRDPQALVIATERLAPYGDAVVLARGEFAEVARICEERGFTPIDGILIDAGVSSLQLDTEGRGFSFRRDEPLDMRMDPDGPTTAADLVNSTSEHDLAGIIFEYGEERRSRRIAHAIVERRPLRTTGDLARAVEAAVGRRPQARIHPATLTFQALRIAVNGELDQLERALDAAHDLLAPGGRLAVISFHSLEDRMVKQFIREHARDCICPPKQPICTCDHRATLRDVVRGGRTASDDEVARNPRARSARLRAAERLAEAA